MLQAEEPEASGRNRAHTPCKVPYLLVKIE